MKRYIPLALAILAAIMLVMSGLGTRAGLWHFRTGFSILKWACYAGIATTLLAIIWLIIPKFRAGNVLPLVIALVIGAAVAYVPWSFQQKARSVPPIHDISTDTERPPEFVAIMPLRADASNPPEYAGPETAAQQHEAYPDIRPVILEVEPAIAFDNALNAAEAMGWEIVATEADEGRIEATATTTWFGFKDDVVIRVEPHPRGSRIDVRSKSRVGRGDVGTNAERVRRYIDRLGPDGQRP